MFFNQIFDALCKLSADSDANVQSAAHLLDRLVKVMPFSLDFLKIIIKVSYISLNFYLLAWLQDIVTESDQFR